jgi:hypothetical protein
MLWDLIRAREFSLFVDAPASWNLEKAIWGDVRLEKAIWADVESSSCPLADDILTFRVDTKSPLEWGISYQRWFIEERFCTLLEAVRRARFSNDASGDVHKSLITNALCRRVHNELEEITNV